MLFGPNGIGKSTAVGMLATRTFPSDGRVFILGHQLGKYDVFKLRTRIGLASADLGRQLPEFEDPLDAVVTGLRSDAGTPGISDPGFLIVRECVKSGIEVQCLPGATALYLRWCVGIA